MAEQLRPEDATIGVITALEIEYAAVLNALECDSAEVFAEGSGAGRRYSVSRVPAANGGHHVVAVALLPDMANDAAGIRAAGMLEQCKRIDHLIMTGIAGAVPHPTKPDDHVRLGDIVVSSQIGVVKYDFDKEGIERKISGNKLTRWLRAMLTTAVKPTDLKKYIREHYMETTEHRHRPRPPSAELLEAFRSLNVLGHRGQYPWDTHTLRVLNASDATWQRPPSETDRLCDWNENWAETVVHPFDADRREGFPRVFSGVIASGDKLLKNPLVRDALREKFGAKAVEMEGAGIADAAWAHGKGYIVVRGTCDYCNSEKGLAWQKYAAVIAAGYTRSLIERVKANGRGSSEDEHKPSAQKPSTAVGASAPGPSIDQQLELERIKSATAAAESSKKFADLFQTMFQHVQNMPASAQNPLSSSQHTGTVLSPLLSGGSAPPAPYANLPATDSISRQIREAPVPANFVEVIAGDTTVGNSGETGAQSPTITPSEQLRSWLAEIAKLRAGLDYHLIVALVDNEILPWLGKNASLIPRNSKAEIYFCIAEIRSRQAMRSTSTTLKKQYTKDMELFIEKAKNEL